MPVGVYVRTHIVSEETRKRMRESIHNKNEEEYRKEFQNAK